MIRLPDTPLPPNAATNLDRWQLGIDSIPDYADRVETAKQQFKSRNVTNNKTFFPCAQVAGPDVFGRAALCLLRRLGGG